MRGKVVYLGFVHIANLESKTISAVLEEREQNGPFKNLENFTSRVSIGIEQLVILIRCNAFRFTGKGKKVLLWEAHMQLGKSTKPRPEKKLFQSPKKEFTLPDLEEDGLEDAYDEIELLGFPVTVTSFDLLETSFRGALMSEDLMKNVGKTVRMVGNLVTIKNVKTVKKEWMHFAAFLDARGEFFDTVHFPKSLQNYPFRGYGVYLIMGMVTEELGFPGITVEKMAKLPLRPDPRY
ncbi:hypothetical protein ACFLTA_10235 [Bacteroidota bacterium]